VYYGYKFERRMTNMKLSECKIGVVVQNTIMINGVMDGGLGHVAGLTLGYSDEVIPTVLWAGEEGPRGIHHDNIALYEE
jgi:hypothetical protein